ILSFCRVWLKHFHDLEWIDVDVEWMRYVHCVIAHGPFFNRIQRHFLVYDCVLEQFAVDGVPWQKPFAGASRTGVSVEVQYRVACERSVDVVQERREYREILLGLDKVHWRFYWLAVCLHPHRQEGDGCARRNVAD